MNHAKHNARTLQLGRRLVRVLQVRRELESSPPVVCIGQGDYGPPWLVKIAQADHLIGDISDRIKDRRRYVNRAA